MAAKRNTTHHLQIEQVASGVRLIRLHRPDCRNALSLHTMLELQAALKAGSRDHQKVCILTGTPPAFSAGGDLNWLLAEVKSKGSRGAAEAVYRGFQGVTRLICDLPMVMISAVNGAAAGAGMDMALACDLCFACPSARFVQSWIKLGLVPATGGAFFVQRRAGWKGLKLAYTGEMITGTDADRLGLVDGLFEDAQLLDETRRIALAIAEGDGSTLRDIKRLIRRQEKATLESYLKEAARMQVHHLDSDFFRNAAAHFIGRK
ncbi:MAG: enoyl-CoA hydratase/isomerase family protein [Nitrospirae bacterium]|nr:enoyl-CoA hydratase/isomerase family protein [Nitrospirota bacterium]